MELSTLNNLYEKLETKSYDVFFEIESGFCTAFEELGEKPDYIKAFIALVNWNNLSSSDGAGAFYEEYLNQWADQSYPAAVGCVLERLGKQELNRFFQMGLREGDIPITPEEREQKDRMIDDYIDEHFDEIWETEAMILTEYKNEILAEP